jgi:hypothetical protein
MLPDHGREIDKYEFSDLDAFALHCQRAKDTVNNWPKWKQNLLNNEPSCGKREPVANEWTQKPNALAGRKLTLTLPLNKVLTFR